MKKILIFVTNHETLGETSEANGTYASELTHALWEFQRSGLDYDIASILGGAAPLYGNDDADDDAHKAIINNDDFQNKLAHTLVAENLSSEDYSAVFYPGGFGLLSDLATNAEVANISAKVYEQGGVIGAVCHGPAGLLPIRLSDGTALLAEKSVTGFTREEEIAAQTIEKIPFLLEESLTLSAGKFSKVQPWQPHIIADGRLITGQNPTSAHGVGLAMVKQLSQ